MRAARAELLKLLTTRAILGLLLGELAVVVLTVASTVASANVPSLSGPMHEQVFYLLTSINVGIFSLIIGIRAFTDDFQHASLVHSFLSDPSRRRTVIAKAVVAVGAAVALAALSLVVMVALAMVVASAKGGDLAVRPGDPAAFAGFLAANGLWAVVGLAVGTLVRHQTPAIVGGLVWVLVVENLGPGFLGDAGGYLPGQSAYALSRALDASYALVPTNAGIVLVLYAVVLLGIALLTIRRRDA